MGICKAYKYRGVYGYPFCVSMNKFLYSIYLGKYCVIFKIVDKILNIM